MYLGQINPLDGMRVKKTKCSFLKQKKFIYQHVYYNTKIVSRAYLSRMEYQLLRNVGMSQI